MKRIYEAPAIEVIEMELEDAVLSTSGDGYYDPTTTTIEGLDEGVTLFGF